MERYIVRTTTSGYNGVTRYNVFRVGGGRVSVHAHATRDAAQVHADELNIGAMVKDYDQDPRPYEERLAEARMAYYSTAKEAPGYCQGCGQTFNGARGLRSHRSVRFQSSGCKGYRPARAS